MMAKKEEEKQGKKRLKQKKLKEDVDRVVEDNRKENPEDKKDKKKDFGLKKEDKKEKKKGKSKLKICCCSCLVILLILILIPIYALFRSGVVKAPLLTPLIYGDDPHPLRQVEPIDNPQEATQQKIQKAVMSNADRLVFSEEEITAQLANLKGIKKPNVAIEDDYIETFLKVDQVKNMPIPVEDVYSTVAFNPNIKDGKMDIKFKYIKIGNLGIPTFLVNFFAGQALEQQEARLEKQLENIDEIILKQGRLVIKGDIKEILKNQMKEEDLPKEGMPQEGVPRDIPKKEIPQSSY